MTALFEQLLRDHHALVSGEVEWRARLRLLQSLWRQEHGWPPLDWKPERGVPYLGSRLPVDLATERGHNFLTPTIFDRVRRELDENQRRPAPDRGLISTPRVFNDLLSSQPLAFNLFAELDRDRQLASRALRILFPNRVRHVTHIAFEWSPGRGDARYLANRSAFDVYIEHTTPAGGHGFIGIEVKYHEDLKVAPGELRERAAEVAAWASLVDDVTDARWQAGPLNQLLLDHLLALSMLHHEERARDGLFVLVHPTVNPACRSAADHYANAVDHGGTFASVTLEEVVAALRAESTAPWIGAFHDRYLALERIQGLVDQDADRS